MSNIRDVSDAFERLVSAATSFNGVEGAVTRGANDHEPFIGFTLVSEYGAASASFWARESVGGLLDFEVIGPSAERLFWRHLEGPNPEEVETTWNDMIATFTALLPASS